MYLVSVHGLEYDSVDFYAHSDDELLEIINFLFKHDYKVIVDRLEEK